LRLPIWTWWWPTAWLALLLPGSASRSPPVREDITQDVARITVPTLVISGEDRVDPPAVLRQHLLPRIAQARLHVLPGIGHLAPLRRSGRSTA
jgi:pimeloyl-ACP methyl ester carboxylesterase